MVGNSGQITMVKYLPHMKYIVYALVENSIYLYSIGTSWWFFKFINIVFLCIEW